MAESKRYYWLKMKRDFFKRHDIHCINGMEGGREILLFYIKLMIESVDHEGKLRFSKEKPYTNGTLAGVTDTPQDIVELAMNALVDFGLVEIDEDKTIILPKVIEMIDSASDSDAARRMRRLREQNVQEDEQNVRKDEQNVQKSEQKRTKRYESIENRDKSIENRETKRERNGQPLYSFGEFKNVMLTTEEHDKLANEYGLETTKCVLEELSGYLVEHPRKYTNHYLALRNWLLKRREDKKPQPIHCQPPKNPYEIDWKALGVKE